MKKRIFLIVCIGVSTHLSSMAIPKIFSRSIVTHRTNLANYSSPTLFFAAIKQFPRDIQKLAGSCTKVVQKNTPTLYNFFANNQEPLKNIALVSLFIGGGYYLAKKAINHSPESFIKDDECPICTNKNQLFKTQCCGGSLCQGCFKSVEETYDKNDPQHREYKHCPFCRKELFLTTLIDQNSINNEEAVQAQ